MNNPNPFLPQGAFLEQKNKARKRLKIAVYFSISLSVMVLMVLLIQGCKKPTDSTESSSGTDTNSLMSQLSSNAPETSTSNSTAMTPPPETNQPVYTPPAPPVTPPAPPVAAGEDYTIVKGDTFATIATKMNVKTKAIVEANPGVDARKLKIGQKIHLPSAASPASAVSAPMNSGATDAAPAGGTQTYKVKSGDTLDGLHKKFKVSIKAIQSANNLSTTSIKVGQVLKIPGSAAASAPAPAPTESLPPPSAPATTSLPAPATMPPAH